MQILSCIKGKKRLKYRFIKTGFHKIYYLIQEYGNWIDMRFYIIKKLEVLGNTIKKIL